MGISKRPSNPDRAYLCKKEILPIKRCFLCKKLLADRGIPNRSGLCSGCNNDCRNGCFSRVKRNVEKRMQESYDKDR